MEEDTKRSPGYGGATLMNNEPAEFNLSNEERVVRAYDCTSLRRWFSKPVIGHLTVTNRRVVYHSSSMTRTGSSVLISEMPIDDVAGISSIVSASVNWIFFIVLAVILHWLSQGLREFLPVWMTSWGINILLMLPFGIFLLIQKRVINQEITEKVLINVKDNQVVKYLKKKDASFYGAIFQVLFFIGLIFFLWNIRYRTELGRELALVSLLLLIGIYFWIYMVYLGRHRTFSLAITSRTAKNSGIYIPGNPLSFLWGRDSTAVNTLMAGPGRDAQTVIKELGAVLTDIQQMGDLGIQKWS
jgi:hypothetical protein